MKRRLALVLALLVLLPACATATRFRTIEQRTTQGPTAEQLWTLQVYQQNGREPTFEEKRHWEDQIDRRIRSYLHTDPEAASALHVTAFRFHRQVTVGMVRDQVAILLGPPAATTTDPAQMESLARRYWPDLRGKVSEAWSYPLGWTLYFSGARLVEITQYLPAT